MWRLAAVLMLPLLLGASYRPTDKRTCRHGGRSRMCQSVGQSGGGGAPPPLLTILPTSGVGVPVMNPSGICDAFGSEFVGQYFCLRGDGTSVLGAGVTLTSSGNVTTVNQRICPNGVNCTAIATQKLGPGSVSRWSSNQAAVAAGDWTMCAFAKAKFIGSPSLAWMSHGTGTWLGTISAPTNISIRIGGAAGPLVSVANSLGRWVFACSTYRRVGAGTSVATIYVDGVSSNSVSNAAFLGAPEFPINVGSTSALDEQDIALALYTEKELSSATVNAMAALVYGSFTASDGVTATGYQRTGLASCKGPDGLITHLNSLRPCITQPAGFAGPTVEIEPSKTNTLIRSQELDTWTLAAATVTAEATDSPDTSITADRITDNATTNEHLVTRTPTLAAGQPHQVSAFFKSGTKTIGLLRYSTTHAAYVDTATGTAIATGAGATATSEAYANGWWRLKLLIASANAVANPVIGVGPANVAGTPSYSGDGTGTIHAWGVMLAASATFPFVTSYVRTEGSTVTRIRSQFNSTFPAGMANAAGCVGVTTLVADAPSGWWMFSPTNGVDNAGHTMVLPGTVQCGDNTNTASVVTGADAQAAPLKSSCEWGGAVPLQARNGSAFGNASYDGSMLGASWTLGSKESTGVVGPWRGWVSNIKLGNLPNACR